MQYSKKQSLSHVQYNSGVNKIRRFFKRFGTDIAGYTCLILVIPVGWLPGPGGIPLLIAGLGLLSANNQWAASLLEYVKKHSTTLRDIFFPKNKKIELAWDIGLISIFFLAFYFSVTADEWYIKALCTAVAAGSTTALLFNRSRLDRIHTRIKKQ